MATAVMHDHVDLLVRAGYTDALAAAMHVVLCNELLHRRPRQSAVATVVFRGFGWYVSRSTEGRYFRHRCDAMMAS